MRKILFFAALASLSSLSVHAAETKFLPGIIENRGDKDGKGKGDLIRGQCTSFVVDRECEKFKIVRLYKTEDLQAEIDPATGRRPLKDATDFLTKDMKSEEWLKELAEFRTATEEAQPRSYARTRKFKWSVIVDAIMDTFTLPSDLKASRTSKKSLEALEAITSSGTVEVKDSVFQKIIKYSKQMTTVAE